MRTPLSVSEIDRFFEHSNGGHLPYRYTMLWRHRTAVNTGTQQEYGDAICSYEASIIACRVFMEFLGLGINYEPFGPVLVERKGYRSTDGTTTHEVKVIDLGGRFATLGDLTAAEKSLLATVFHMAHKATAHLTHGAPYMDSPRLVDKCIPVVDRLLHKCLYDIVGKKPLHHWK